MEHTKFIVLLTIVASASSNDLTLGQGDRGLLIYNITVEASPAIWRQIDTIVVNATENKVISKIDITDLRPEKDGEAKITDGGVGLKDVTIELKSPTVLRGYKFLVQVFEEEQSTRGISTTEGAKGNQENKHPSIVGQDFPNFKQARTNLDDTKSHGHIPVLSTSSTTESSRKYPEHSSRNTRDAIKAEPSPPVAGVKDSDKEHASSTPAPKNNKNAADTKDAKSIEPDAKSFAEIPSSNTADAPKTKLDSAKTTPHTTTALTPEATTKHNADHKRDTKEATEKPVKISAVKSDMNLEPKDAKGNDTGVKILTDASIVTPATHLASTNEPKTNMDAAKTTPVSFSDEATTKHSADHKRDTKEATDKAVKLPVYKNEKSLDAKDAKINDSEAKTPTDIPAANPITLESTEAPKTNMDATKTSPHPVGVTPDTSTKHSADHKRDTKEAADKAVKLPEIKNGKGLEAKDAKLNETAAKSLTDIPIIAPINLLASTSVPKTNLDSANTTPVTVHSESTTKHSTDHKRDTKETSDKLVKGSVTDFTTEAAKKHENIDHKLNKDNIKTSDLPKVDMKSDSTTKHDVEHKMNEDKNKSMPKATGISEKDLNPYGPAPVIDDFDFEAQLTSIMTRNKDAKTKAIGSDLKPDAPESTHDVKNDAMNLNKNGQKTKDDIENTKPYPYLSRPQTPSGNAKLESTTKHSEHKRDTKDDKHKDTKENNPKETKEDKMEKSESKTVDEVKNAAHDKATATKTGAELKPIVSLQ
ncbi:mucin-5AC [Plutella xylostella]|uniref:mucin-5AC n=1 Tax=Plutella xylostella TaxID=51655 RepID=UPI002032C5CA|nr:mucin-5AC [Plutella xylostella]